MSPRWRLGDFNTWNVGAAARLLWKGLSLGVATHVTGDGANIRTNYGTWPGYLALMVTDFDRANEKAFGIGLHVGRHSEDCAGLTPERSVPGRVRPSSSLPMRAASAATASASARLVWKFTMQARST